MKFLRLFHDYSLAIVLGAPICLHLFALSAKISLPFSLYPLLSLAVAFIYGIDHLGDNAELLQKNKRFVFTSFLPQRKMWLLALLLLFLSVYFLFRGELQTEDWATALICTSLWGVYVVLRIKMKLRFFERIAPVWIAVVVTSALSLPVLLRQFDTNLLLYVFLFFILCLQNLFLFSIADFEKDKSCSKQSFATLNGLEFTFQLFDIMALSGFAFALDEGFEQGFTPFISSYLVMQILLFMGRVWGIKKVSNWQVRIWSDSIFLVPAIWIFI